jgi:hypothetical protein
MSKYAFQTKVPVDQTRREIERVLDRYGADQFALAIQTTRAVIGFRMAGRYVKFTLELPDGKTEGVERAAREQRRRWRALLLVIKAKLEAVQSGITIFDHEFMAHIVMPDGETLADKIGPQIESAYKTGKMPPLLGFIDK